MITETFIPDKGYLESAWTGIVDLPQVVDYIRRTKSNNSYPRKLKILSLAHEAQMDLDLEDLKVISNENRLSLENYESITDAFIIDKAIEAALTTMYQGVSAVEDYFFKIFSTREAAEEWLDMM